MAHFAELNENNIVKQVIVINNNELLDEAGNESEQKGIDFCVNLFGGKWIQTSFNTYEGKHSEGKIPLRKNYAVPGMVYDVSRNAFYIQQPFPSWALNEETCMWESPVPYPMFENPYTPDQEEFWAQTGDVYVWNETNQSWDVA
jgi:hypothetical protein